MHAQMDRLYQAAYEIKGIRGQSALAFALNESPQTISNWESRGISSNGLLSAQEKIGCNAVWVRDGVGTMRFDVDASGTETIESEEVAIKPGDPFPLYPSYLSDRLAWAIAQKAGRENRKITYADLMRATEVTKGAVSCWKQNKNGIRGETAKKAAIFLEVDPVWLETGYGTPEGDFSMAAGKSVAHPTPIQSSLVTIVGSLVADGKLTDNMCLMVIAYINGVLALEKAAGDPEIQGKQHD